MPYINTKTTEKLDTGAIERLTKAFGEAIELIPGKTERWLMLNFDGECKMAFSGKVGECCMIEVEIFGRASDAAYNALTKRLTEIASAEMKLPPDRIYVKYEEIGHWGWSGENF